MSPINQLNDPEVINIKNPEMEGYDSISSYIKTCCTTPHYSFKTEFLLPSISHLINCTKLL